MKAITYNQYGSPDAFCTAELDTPTAGPDEVLIQVKTVGLNAYDWRMLYGKPFPVRFQQGLIRPNNHILGSDISGIIKTVGDAVIGFHPDDEVLCCLEGAGTNRLATGGLAEFVVTKSSTLVRKPNDQSFDQAASLPMAGVTALQAVRDVANVRPGTRVLVNGASGGVGTFVLQIAKMLGAHVTGVCSASHIPTAENIGADHVIDYATQDFTEHGDQYDAIIDVAANRSVHDLRKVIRKGGVIASVGFSTLGRMATTAMAASNKKSSKRVVMVTADNSRTDDLAELVQMVTNGTIQPVIDRTFPIDETARAFRYIKSGHTDGKVIVRVA